MSDADDPLGGEISVTVKVEEGALTGKAKSRALVALDRLIGNILDIPSALVERKAALIRARTSGAKDLLAIEIEAAKQKLMRSANAGEAAIDAYYRDVGRKLENRAAVATNTIIALEEGQHSTEDADQSGQPEPDGIEDDWLNLFSTHAENASSEHMRDLWGRVLAGEIRKPKSFSLSTLRMLSELDREIASLFEKYMVGRLPDGFLPKPQNFQDQLLLDLTFLEEVGLLQDVNGSLGRDLNVEQGGYSYYIADPRVLRFKPKDNQPLRLELIRITRVGREIAAILPPEPIEKALKLVAETLRSKCESIEIANVRGVPGNYHIDSAFVPI